MIVVDTTAEHVASIRERLTPASAESCRRVYGVDIRDVLDKTWDEFGYCWTLMCGELPIVISGLAEISDELAQPWSFLTNEVESHRAAVAWWSLFVLELYQKRYPELELWLDLKNDRSVRWHKWLGFKFDEPAPHGPHGYMCVHGTRRR